MAVAARQHVVGAINRVNAFQDYLIRRYCVPYSITLTYWSFAFVFLYLGVQKVHPHRSTADVQLAIIGGLIGVPYVHFVAFIGLWQMAIGVGFLLRRLRFAGMLFVLYQVFAFGSLVVLRHVVFQPPYIPIFSLELPWALGVYAAFILKNLVFAGVFFVLAAHEYGEAGSGDVR